MSSQIEVIDARHHNLKNVSVRIPKYKINVITGVSGSGKSSLAYDIILQEANRVFFSTLSYYARQFMDVGARPDVRKVSGLAPSIGLTQRETRPSNRATIASFTDIQELLGVLLNNHGMRYCPTHHIETETFEISEYCRMYLETNHGKMVGVYAPLVIEKTGNHRELLQKMASRGFIKAWIDHEHVSITPVPNLERTKKHTIRMVIDILRLTENNMDRFIRAVQLAVEQGDGQTETSILANSKHVPEDFAVYSIKGGCPECGYSWPKLDPRFFSPNSLGRCKTCRGLGVIDEESIAESTVESYCLDCGGTGIDKLYGSIKYGSFSILDLLSMDVDALYEWVHTHHVSSRQKGASIIFDQVSDRLDVLRKLGLGFLNMYRRLVTISSGEYQRLRLSSILSTRLKGVIYVIDEPSQGLHQSEMQIVWNAIENLKKSGNTVILVEHDTEFIKKADWLVEMGPGGGKHGGEVLAVFKPHEAERYEKISPTARILINNTAVLNDFQEIQNDNEKIELRNVKTNNLNIEYCQFYRARLNVVCGKSGAGKNSLVIKTLYRSILDSLSRGKERSKNYDLGEINGIQGLEGVSIVDRNPIGKSSSSMPLSYLKIFDEMRKLFAATADAQVNGLSVKDFSLFAGNGRCEECGGKGTLTRKIRFLSETEVKCKSCQGKRYKERVLSIKYLGLSISEMMDLTLSELEILFANHKRIQNKIKPAIDLGLGYLVAGQPLSSLSGGEAQRIKLIPVIGRRNVERHVIILEEPTIGLHETDSIRLVKYLLELRDRGATLIIIENDPIVKKNADFLIELGPGSGKTGGTIVFQGSGRKVE